MSYKSRQNWQINLCLRKNCKNRNKKCKSCVKFSNFLLEKPNHYENNKNK